jgi:hypothetical protein
MTTLLDSFSKTFIGIEFRDDTLIISCLKNDLSGLRFLSSSTFPLKSDDETIAEMKSFIAENVRGPHEVCIAVPHTWAIIKFIELPSPKAKGKDTLAHMMKFEIERHVPFPVEDIFFDFQVISKSGSTYNVIAAAVHKDRIHFVQEFLEKFPLKPGVITLSSFAIFSAIECDNASIAGWHAHMGFSRKPGIWGGKGETCIFLLLENDNAYCALFSDGDCQFISAFRIDRNTPDSELAEYLASRVSDILSEFSLVKTDRIIVSGMTEPFSERFEVSGRSFRQASQPIPNNENLRSRLPEVLGEKFGTSVQTYHPLAKLIPGQEEPQLLHLAPSIGACYLGLDAGTFHINLLPHKTGALFRKTGALVSKIAVPLILLMIIGIFAGNIINDKRILEKIDSQIKKLEPDIKSLEKLTSDIKTLEKDINFLYGVKESSLVLEVLSEMTGLIPEDAWISNFQYKVSVNENDDSLKGELIISGFAQSSSILISILEDSLFFEKVEFVGPIKKRRGMEEFRIKVVTVRPALPDVPATPEGAKKTA